MLRGNFYKSFFSSKVISGRHKLCLELGSCYLHTVIHELSAEDVMITISTEMFLTDNECVIHFQIFVV